MFSAAPIMFCPFLPITVLVKLFTDTAACHPLEGEEGSEIVKEAAVTIQYSSLARVLLPLVVVTE
jgi:hypothetical protein